MRIIFPAILSILVFSTFNCKTDAVPEVPKKAKHLFAKHYVRYLQTEKELKAEVSFKQGDTLSKARSIVLANVTFENNQMDPQNLGKSYGIRYAFRKTGPYSDQYEFKYTSEQFGRLSHILKMSPITDFLIKEGMINKKSGATIVWKGDALAANQELVLLFIDEEKKAFPVQIKGPTERSELFLSTEKLKGLAVGKGNLMIVKKQLSESTENNLTKISEMEFYSNTLDIEVIE
ncbi:MAG: hypothetical protein ACI8P3_000217 [Saprospiraceae bacterium]|jgi:hypothetical protein